MIIQNGLVFTEQGGFIPASVHYDEKAITGIQRAEDCNPSPVTKDVFDAEGCYVLPGLTDIHFHGCDGHDFCEGTMDAFDAIASFECSLGVTSICPATMTLPAERISDICEAAACYRSRQTTSDSSLMTADLVGLHLEGPFISPAKKGAQNESYIQMPDASLLYGWQEKAQGLIRLVSLAPELAGALSCIEKCHEDFHFSIAHTEADYDTATAAFMAGADHVTHLYNAMPPFSHRASGVIGAAVDRENAFVELICDGVHISPSVVRATFKLFGKDRVILISDSMEATGKPDGNYQLGGLAVNVSGSHATLSDGTLAGSVTPLYRCLITAVSMGIPLKQAVMAATLNPCRSIGIEDKYGSIAVGKKPHFLILDQKDLSIKAIIKGRLCR